MRFPLRFGARNSGIDQTEFSVWAPRARSVKVQIVRIENDQETVLRALDLTECGRGIFQTSVDDCPPGTLYRFQLNGQRSFPDPYSRYQPYGVHGPSQIVNPTAYSWTDESWAGIEKQKLIVYELHIGAFSNRGTFRAAIDKLDQLVGLGVNAVELMPVAQSPGRWNWGYDGVNYFAPRNTYGSPAELKQLVDECHRRGLAAILDVVYNHIGPEGNYLNEFGSYRSSKFSTPWGDALNFCGRGSKFVREFVIANALFWIDEYHFDGLRLDAIHYMFDDSQLHIVDEVQQRFRTFAESLDRKIYLIGETNIFDAKLIGNVSANRPHYDAIWSDCLMHSIYAQGCPETRLSGRQYVPGDLATALSRGYIFATPNAVRVDTLQRDERPASSNRDYLGSMIIALQTHDSVGNHPQGKRLHELTSFHFQKAAAALILLYPAIPMIFMGEEWAADVPFPFFADFEDSQLRKAVDRGRRREYPHHDWSDSPLPSDPRAFEATKLSVHQGSQEMWEWYRDLLDFRSRGQAEGWLSMENYKTYCSENDDRFSLVYETSTRQIHVCVRLAKPHANPICLSLENRVAVVLDSRAKHAPADSTTAIELQAQHCCIWTQSINSAARGPAV